MRRRGLGKLARFQAIEPGQQFCHRNVKLGWNMCVQVHLHQQADQFAGFVHIQAVFFGGTNDGVRQLAVAFGNDARGAILVVVGNGDRGVAVGIGAIVLGGGRMLIRYRWA